MKKLSIAFLVYILLSSMVFAFGKKETVETPAQNLDSWLESVNIEDKKNGKYNILITAEDLAGNVSNAGPYNIFIDPDSDLPVVRITNPLEGMRVPGNLNIVGTCIDDDAVASVELVLDDGEVLLAEGTDFWSYYLDTTLLEEGPHTISVYGVDINGVRGKPYTVVWNLDRNQPETEVTNITIGSLVSGKFTLSGTIADGNGIRQLQYSTDSGSTFLNVPIKTDKKKNITTFSLSLDSTKQDDGPSVVWFKAEDGQLSQGIYTFLYFVDNTKPEIVFIHPEITQAVNGKFTLSGLARDTVSLASLSYKYGKETGTFDLVKGNPYWAKEFDVSSVTSKDIEIEITATDTAGNVVKKTRKILIDRKADLPVLSLDQPIAGELVEDSVFISGSIIDDDGVQGFSYSLNKASPVKIDSTGSFAFTLDNLTAGKYTLELIPFDINGTEGLPVLVSFASAGTSPTVQFPPASARKVLDAEAGESILVEIGAPGGIKNLEWTVTGMSAVSVPVKQGTTAYSLKIPVSPQFPYGSISLAVSVTDVAGRQTNATSQWYVTNYSIPRGESPQASEDSLRISREVQIPATGKIPASSGIASLSFGDVLPNGSPFENGMNVILSGPTVPKAAQSAGSITVNISSPIPISSFNWSLGSFGSGKSSVRKIDEVTYESSIPLSALLSATWIPISATLVLRDTSELSISGYISVLRPLPQAGVYDERALVWENLEKNNAEKNILLNGKALVGLYTPKTNRSAASVRFEPPVAGLEIALGGNYVSITGSQDGEYKNIKVIISDSEGEEFQSELDSLIVDFAPPLLTIDRSSRPELLQNVLPLTITAQDGFSVASIEHSFDGGQSWENSKNFVKNAVAKSPTALTTSANEIILPVEFDITTLPEGPFTIWLRAIDGAGRESLEKLAFIKDTVPPSASVVFPQNGESVNGETLIGFSVQDASGLLRAEYRRGPEVAGSAAPEWIPFELSSLPHLYVGTMEKPISSTMELRFTDKAGNSKIINSYEFMLNPEADLPIVQIHVPSENEVMRKDFIVSGVVYDDDQPARIWYQIDNNPLVSIETESSYSIPIALSSLTDNEHTITIFAEDIHGVQGLPVVRTIRVSLEEPKAEVTSPSFEKTNRGLIEITGLASDKNGIDRVEISLDNGNKFNRALGTTEWSYSVDTRVIQDGTHVIFVRVFDSYGTSGLYSSLINIDNTDPSIKLELPLDGSRTASTLFISGQTIDNIYLETVTAKISNIDSKQPAVPAKFNEIVFENSSIISGGVDVSSLPVGFYNIEVRGIDRAGNITRVSRNFEVYRGEDRNRIEFLYPMNGEPVQGLFNVYGRVVSEDDVSTVLLFVDGVDVATTDLNGSGYFKFAVGPDLLSDGGHSLSVRALAAGERIIQSEEHVVFYGAEGPWVTIDNFVMGDFAIDRPWLEGTTGYSLSEDDVIALRSKSTHPDIRKQLQAKAVEVVEISFDNGKTFMKTESGKKWRYRLETGDLAEGYHFIVVRALMKNGEKAITRSIVQIDKTNPSIRLISPSEGGRYNQELVFSGLSSDDVQLSSVMLALRPGDKSAYAVPSFIQGLYFDWHFWGATLYDVGLGLTFFDDNVKVQAQFGQFTAEQRSLFTDNPMRYGGNVLGFKMLANLLYLPMDFFFGPNFSWLSATGAIGANFSYFSKTQSGKAQTLSAILAQIEFFRVTIPKRKTFKTFSLYSELQLWFIPTDVDSSEVSIKSLVPHVTGGARLNLF